MCILSGVLKTYATETGLLWPIYWYSGLRVIIVDIVCFPSQHIRSRTYPLCMNNLLHQCLQRKPCQGAHWSSLHFKEQYNVLLGFHTWMRSTLKQKILIILFSAAYSNHRKIKSFSLITSSHTGIISFIKVIDYRYEDIKRNI